MEGRSGLLAEVQPRGVLDTRWEQRQLENGSSGGRKSVVPRLPLAWSLRGILKMIYTGTPEDQHGVYED